MDDFVGGKQVQLFVYVSMGSFQNVTYMCTWTEIVDERPYVYERWLNGCGVISLGDE